MKFKVGNPGWKVALGAFFVVLLIVMLQKFAILDFSSQIANIIVVFAAVFLGVEVLRERSGKKLTAFETIGVILAGVVFLTAILSIVGVQLAFMAPFEGMVLAVLLVFIVVELFKK